MGYRVTFIEGGEHAIISTPPDQDGVLTQYDAPFNSLTQLYELLIMPHVERGEEDQEENVWTLPVVLGGHNDSLKCTCHMNHSMQHPSHHPNLLDDEHFHVEEAMCFAMSDTLSGNMSADQMHHSRLGHPGNNPKLLKRLSEVVGKAVDHVWLPKQRSCAVHLRTPRADLQRGSDSACTLT